MKRTSLAGLFALSLLSPTTLTAATQPEAETQSDQETQALQAMFPESAPSEADVYRADQLLVTATGSLKPVRLAPSVATVITAEEIEKMGARTLNEVLETVPGLHVGISNKNMTEPIYSIRGIHTSLNPQVLVLVNGVKINRDYTGGMPFRFQMPVSMISRVEVVRGPGSALYGADAFAGVINVITKDGKEIDGLRGGVRYGSFDTMDGWAQYGGEKNGWDIAMSVDYMSSNGDSDRIINSDLQGMLDSVLGTDASLAPGALPTEYGFIDARLAASKDAWTARLWLWQQNNADMVDGFTQTLSADSAVDTSLYQAELAYDNRSSSKDSGVTANLSVQREESAPTAELFPDNAVMPIGADGNIDFVSPVGTTFFPDGVIGAPPLEAYRSALDTAYHYSGFAAHKLRMGAGVTYSTAEPSESKNFGPGVLDSDPLAAVSTGSLTEITDSSLMYMENQYRTVGFLSAQDEWAFAKGWELTAGVRYDHYSDFGSTINPRLAMVWETTPALTTKLLYGHAFRAPSLVELYAINNPSNLGNPDLEPETIDTYELAFNWEATRSLNLGTNLFYYSIDGLIELVQDEGQTTATSQNAKDQEGHGVELEAGWTLTKTLKIKGNIAWQQAEDKDTGEDVPDAPQLQFYTNAHWEFLPTWSLNGQWFWVGERQRADDDDREAIDNYNFANLTLRKKELFQNVDLAVAARNIFNQEIREPSQSVIRGDYPMTGQAFWVELSFHF